MEIENMSIKEIKQKMKEKDSKKKITCVVKGTPFKIGASYLIRTVTMIYTGRLNKVYDKWLELTDCAWIPETKRWTQTIEKGEFEEIEPYPNKKVIIGLGAILDMTEVDWELPNKQK